VACRQFVIRPTFSLRTYRERLEDYLRRTARPDARNERARESGCSMGRGLERLLEATDGEIAQPCFDECSCRPIFEGPQIEQMVGRSEPPADTWVGQLPKRVANGHRQQLHRRLTVLGHERVDVDKTCNRR